MPDFVEIYDDVLSPEICQQIIDQFESEPRTAGLTAGGLDASKKLSQDVGITGKPEWSAAFQHLTQAVSKCLLAYIRKYPFMVASVFNPEMPDPETGEMRALNEHDIPTVSDQELGAVAGSLYRLADINLQKYNKGEGHFNRWHSEFVPLDTTYETLHRVLFFIVYLNDVAEGGETELYYQQKKLVPRTGRIVLSPCMFTHTHRGNVPVSGDKYIATSWVLYQRAENLR